jgi:chemotaxis protein histidine kinase CheA
MITSFSRLFRQIFGGSRAQPATEALTRDIVADAEAREAAEHRENLKRAMEAAFATPTAAPEEPHEEAPQPVLELQAAVEEAAAEIVAPEPAREEPLVEAPQVAQAETFVAEAPQPLVTEHPPAIDLAEVEEQREHDIEILQWDVAKLAEDTTERAAPAVEERTAEIEPVTEVEEETPAETIVEEETPEAVTAAEEPVAEEAAAPKAKRTKKAKAPAKKKAATKKKAAPKKSAGLPDDAVWLSDAIAFSLKGEWSSVWTPPEDASGAERLELFREKAAAGDLTIWGKPDGAGAWEPVKATYWKTAFVDPLSFLMGRENVTTDPSTSKAKKPVKYIALKVAQAEVETLWPPATETVRNAA